MGNKAYISVLIIFALTLISCSSVRKNLLQPPERNSGISAEKSESSRQEEIQPQTETTPHNVDYQKARTAPDTVYLHIEQSDSQVKPLTEINKSDPVIKPEEASQKLVRAQKLFDDGKLDDSFVLLKQIVKETGEGRAERYEAQFYCAEYDIAKKNFSSAEFRLGEMLANKGLPDTVREKVLVRLGQTYCLDNQKQKSATYYKMLKKEYPQSRYIPLAICAETGKN